MTNQQIRDAAKAHGVKLWELADALGVTDSTLSRKLRHELSGSDKTRALEAIVSIAAARNAAQE